MFKFSKVPAIRQLALASTALGALLAATPALAEAEAAAAEAADDSGIVDIVVTAARRRDESAQDVPVALSVVSAASLERRGDYSLGQIQQQVPSLQVFSFNPRNTNVNIRGLGSNVALTNDGLETASGSTSTTSITAA